MTQERTAITLRGLGRKTAAARGRQGSGSSCAHPRVLPGHGKPSTASRAAAHSPASARPLDLPWERSDARGVGGARCPRAVRQPTPARASPVPRHAQGLRPRSASTEASLARLTACAGGQPAVAVLLVRAARPGLDAGALRHYITNAYKEGGTTAEDQWQGRHSRIPPGAVSDPQSPLEGVAGWQEAAARAECSGAGAFLLEPPGGALGRQGAASVRARCRADGGPERRLAAQRPAGAVQRRRCISRCTDRSAGGCADWRTLVTTRARACDGLDAAEASPPRWASWRSRGRLRRGLVSLGHRACASPGRRLPHFASGWQRR